jgi:ERCC4-type nuclease
MSVHVIVDSREQNEPPWPKGITTERATLHEGDYTTPLLRGTHVIERKNPADLVASLTWERERFDRELDRLSAYDGVRIVVEASLEHCCTLTATRWEAIVGSWASFAARNIGLDFAESPVVAGRLIAGTLRRWELRVAEKLPPLSLPMLLRNTAEKLLEQFCQKCGQSTGFGTKCGDCHG